MCEDRDCRGGQSTMVECSEFSCSLLLFLNHDIELANQLSGHGLQGLPLCLRVYVLFALLLHIQKEMEYQPICDS